ncbi:hypothetical protein EY643_13740 [Halioglobus maricola]|uniref:Uncharacterized protein n=1 Tax=Halioglobus maricola TaxID=2601894 RepID=A0A5P9NLK5_9GAMM|nr:hypothetical protein [Halioglobus maricola]QFU76632.1 hypothetical protein EY643_13740 [Halioglobus maricola]
MITAIWMVALAIYLAFRLWYDGLRKPLSVAEVEKYTRLLEQSEELDATDLAVMKKFLEKDDGREFIMVNLLQFNASPIKHPDTGQDARADAVLQEYFRPFMGRVVRRAGHPVITSRAVGGYLDGWNTPSDPGWHAAGLIRYRSRRDFVELSFASSSFQDIHKYKIAALQQTFAFPAQSQVNLYASPRVTVAMVLALAAMILQLILS